MVDELRELLARWKKGQVAAEDALRAMLSHPGWRVAYEDGQPEVVELDDGTRLVVAESAAPEGREVDGRALVCEVAPAVGGVVFDPDEPWGTVFEPEQLAGVQRWARVVDLERAIAQAGPGQASLLLEGPWWVAVTPGTREAAVHRHEGLDVVTVLTAPDAVATFQNTEHHRKLEVVELGSELWADLALRTDFDGIRLNPLRPLSRVWPPHLPAELVSGRDPRPNAAPLPARTVAEIHLWLDQQGARPDKRTHTLRTTPSGMVAVYKAWWGYEPREVVFETVEPTPDPLDLGEGKTRILCAGLLFQAARSKLAGLPEDPSRADDAQRQRAGQAARWLFELEKLVRGERVPFSALRTPEGAHLWHLEPEAFTAQAIRDMRQQAEALAGTV